MNIWIDAQLYQAWLNTYNLRRLGEAERNPTSVRDNSWVPLRSNATCYNAGDPRNAVAPQPTTTTSTIEINPPISSFPHLPISPVTLVTGVFTRYFFLAKWWFLVKQPPNLDKKSSNLYKLMVSCIHFWLGHLRMIH
jgi:hypothetical protein